MKHVDSRLLTSTALRLRAPETKDGDDDKILQDVKKTVDGFMTAFEEFKSANEERIKQVEKKGVADPATLDKLQKIEAAMTRGEELGQKFAQIEQAQKAAKDQAEETDKLLAKLEAKLNRPGAGTPEQKALERKQRANLWGRAVVLAHTIGVPNLSDDQRKCLEAVAAEWKSLNVGSDVAGGYLAPMDMATEITKGITEISPVRSLARVRTTALKAYQLPKRTGQFAAQWVAEQGTRSETTGLAYGLDEVPTWEFYALIDISSQMLEDSAFDMEMEIKTEGEEQFALAEGTAFVSGNGVGKPEGFLSNAGVGTTNSGHATQITADGLLTLKHAIKTGYTANANFVLNRTSLGAVRKLKDGSGQYLWMPGIAQGKPNSIDGDPYVEMPDMPNEGAGAKPVAYGDFRRAYTWIDRIALEMLRDPYTQATSGNVRFILRKRVGGKVVLAEAIRTLTCTA